MRCESAAVAEWAHRSFSEYVAVLTSLTPVVLIQARQIGIGALYTTTYFPVLAPLPVTRAAPALAFYNFSRTFAQVCSLSLCFVF